MPGSRLQIGFLFRSAIGVMLLLAASDAHAFPTTSVRWQNLVGGTTPAAAALLDVDAATPLHAGTTGTGDGTVLVLGYFAGGTNGVDFSGTWVPLSGPQSANVPFRTSSIGDNVANASGAFGFFALQSDFDLASMQTSQNLPPAGTKLAVAIFNRATFAASTHCTIAINDAWLWKDPPATPLPEFVDIDLNDVGTRWLGGAASARVTSVPVAQFPGYPVISNAPTSMGFNLGEPLLFAPDVTGDATLTLQWYRNNVAIPGATMATFAIGTTTAGSAGDYFLRASNAAGSAETAVIRVGVHSTAARLLNLSTRGFVGTGDGLLIPGFVAVGSGNKPVLIRAVGPTLGTDPFNVPGVLANPQLSLRNDANVELAFNDDWRTPAGSDAVAAAIVATGAFPIPDGSLDAALLFNAPVATNVSVHVTGVGGGTGVVITEVYVVDDGATPDARLINLSTRGFVGTGDNVMIPGFYLGSGGTRRLLIRAAGPTLGEIAPGLAPILADPVMRVRRTSNQEEVGFNDNWQDGGQGPDITAATTAIGAGFPLHDGWADAALILTVDPSAPGVDDRGFTIEIFDANGGTGLVIAEIYELP